MSEGEVEILKDMIKELEKKFDEFVKDFNKFCISATERIKGNEERIMALEKASDKDDKDSKYSKDLWLKVFMAFIGLIGVGNMILNWFGK